MQCIVNNVKLTMNFL